EEKIRTERQHRGTDAHRRTVEIARIGQMVELAHAHDDHPHGWRRYVYSTNHKDIGTMYLIFAICAGCIGGFLSMMVRANLMYPGDLIFHDPHRYNVFGT